MSVATLDTAPTKARSLLVPAPVTAPDVSVIVPCYNGAETLHRTLKTLEAQTHKALEVVIVDDGSTDDTLKIAKAWCARHPRFRVISRRNSGVSAARNAGVQAAAGEWILFHDADDYLDRRAVERLLQAAEAHPDAQVVAGRAARVDSQGRTWDFPTWDLSDAFGTLSKQCGLAIHSAIVRRSAVLAVGGFDRALVSAEDWDLWQRIARTGAKFHQIDALVAYYQSRAQSLSKNVRQLAEDTLKVLDRGHAADPRVAAPAPAHAQGATDEDKLHHHTTFILWSAARAIAGGSDGVSLLDLLPANPVNDLEPEGLGEMLAGGMADFLSVLPPDLASKWTDYAPRLRVLLSRAYPGPGRERPRDLALLTVKNRFNVPFQHDALPDTAVVAEAVCDLDSGADGVLVEAEAVAIQFRKAGRAAGLVIRPLDGVLSGLEISQAVAEQVSRLSMAALAPVLKPWRSPLFWRAAAPKLARAAALRAFDRNDPDARGALRRRLRQAFASGVEALVSSKLAPEFDFPTRTRPRVVTPARVWRAAAKAQSLSETLPILMYHQVADHGPEALKRWRVSPADFAAQMQWLADNGYYTVTPQDWAQALTDKRPLAGKPVLITFDDGYQDFADNAWPVLQQHGFTATMFVVADKVGGHADWDAQYGEPAPLMDWDTLRALQAEGLVLGSHTAGHIRLSLASSAEVVEEARISRLRMLVELGDEPAAFCYPYGGHDRVVEQLVAQNGYALGFTCEGGRSTLGGDPMRLPRLEVEGGVSLDAFARKLTASKTRL